jgi:hypothetical protein
MSLKNKLLIWAIALGSLGDGSLNAQDKVNDTKMNTIENLTIDWFWAEDWYLNDVDWALRDVEPNTPAWLKYQALQDMTEIINQLRTPWVDERIVDWIIADRVKYYAIEDYDSVAVSVYLRTLNEYLYKYLTQSLDNFIYDKMSLNQSYNDFMRFSNSKDENYGVFAYDEKTELLKYKLKDIREWLSNIHEWKYNSEEQKREEYIKYLKQTEITLKETFDSMKFQENWEKALLLIIMTLVWAFILSLTFAIVNRTNYLKIKDKYNNERG